MSQPEQQEQGERAIMKPVEAKALQAADAQSAKMAGAADIQAAQALNPDRHSGSAGGDQNQSIEIVAMGKDGRQQVLAARPKEQKQEPPLTPEYLRERAKQDDIWAKKFVADIDQAQKLPSPYRDGHIAKVLKDAEAVYRPTGQAQKPQLQPDQFNTEEMLAQASEKSPAAQAVSLFKQWVEKQPDSPQKEAFRQEVRQQAADLSPEMKDKMEQRAKLWQKVEAAGLDEGGTHKAIRPELANNLTGRVEHNQPLENTADGWLVAGQAIARLPIEKQAEVIGAGLKAGTEQYQQEERERAIGRLIGSVQGGGQVSVNLAVIAEFSADVVCGNKERAMERGDKFGEAVGQTIVSGVGLFKDADQYLFNVGYSGDYGKPFKDVAELAAGLNDRWSQLPPREQERIKYKFITEMVADGVIAGGGAKAIGKAKEFTEVLDAVAEQAAEHAIKHGGKALEASKKAASTIAGAIDDLMSPEMALSGGGKMKFPRDFGKPADKPITQMEMSKSKDLPGGASPEQPNNVKSGKHEKPDEVRDEALDNPEGLAKLAKKFGINMPPKDTFVFCGEKNAISAEAAAKRLGITKEQLQELDEMALVAQKLERVPDYRDAFFNAYPGLIPVADRLVIHHGLPKWLLKGEYQGLFTAKELNDVKYLRGIYSSVNYELHNKQIHNRWLEFQAEFPKATRQQALDWLHRVDEEYGRYFAPVEGKGNIK